MSKEGKDTSEFAVTKSVGWMAKLAIVVGAVLALLPAIIDKLPIDGQAALWGGIVLAAVAVVAQVLSALGYQVSRTRVKEAEAAKKLK